MKAARFQGRTLQGLFSPRLFCPLPASEDLFIPVMYRKSTLLHKKVFFRSPVGLAEKNIARSVDRL